MVARAKAAKKPMRRKSAANGERVLNTLIIEVAAAEKEKRRSNSNRGSVDAQFPAAVDGPAREQLYAALQRTRSEMNAITVVERKRKLEQIKEETAAASDGKKKKDESAGFNVGHQEKKEEAASSRGSRQGRRRTQRETTEAARKRKKSQQHQKTLPWTRR